MTVLLFLILLLVLPAHAREDPGPPPDIKDLREFFASERLDEAEALLQDWLQRDQARPDSPDRAECLVNLALVYKRAGDFKKARPSYEQALGLRKIFASGDSLLLARELNRYGNFLYEAGEEEAAIAPTLQGLGIRKRHLGNTHPKVAYTLNGLANIEMAIGHYPKSVSIFEEALSILEEQENPPLNHIATILDNQANACVKAGRMKKARRAYEKSLSLKRSFSDKPNRSLARGLKNLGRFLIKIRDLRAAREHILEAEAIYAEIMPEHPQRAWAQTALGDLAWSEEQFQQALEYYEAGLNTYLKSRDPLHRSVLSTRNNCAACLWQLGRLEEARDELEELLQQHQETFGQEHPATAHCRLNLAEVLLEQGELEHAGSLAEEGLASSVRRLGNIHPRTNTMRELLSRIHLTSGKREEAFQTALTAEEMSLQHRVLMVQALPEHQARSYAGRRPGSRNLLLSILETKPDPASLEEAWNALLRSRARVLDEMLIRQSPPPDPSLLPLQEELDRRRSDLARFALEDLEIPEELRQQRLEEARQEKQKAELALADKSEAYREQVDLRTANLAALRKALPEGSALLAFFRYSRYPDELSCDLALVMRKDREALGVIPLGPSAPRDSLIEVWQGGIRAARKLFPPPRIRESRYRESAEALRVNVWDPLAPELVGLTTLFVVPDGPLSLLSFASLPMGSSGYLADEEMALHRLSCERDLLRVAALPGTGMLALGNPEYGEPSGGLLGSFTALPGTARELSSLPLASEDIVLSKQEAGEAALKALAPGRRMLHLASHAYFLSEEEVEGRTFDESPLLSCGVALAGSRPGHLPLDGRALSHGI